MTPVKFNEDQNPSILQCPRCGNTHLTLMDATLYERSADQLTVQISHVGSGRPFVRQQVSGGSGNPSPHGDGLTIQLGCFWCSRKNPKDVLTLALFERRNQIELAWAERERDGRTA